MPYVTIGRFTRGRMLAHVLIVGTEHRQPVERQVMQELDEALLQTREIAVMRDQVIVVDVGDDRDQRLQVQERGIALVRLGHQIATGAEPGIRRRRS